MADSRNASRVTSPSSSHATTRCCCCRRRLLCEWQSAQMEGLNAKLSVTTTIERSWGPRRFQKSDSCVFAKITTYAADVDGFFGDRES